MQSAVDVLELTPKNQRNDGHQFDEDVKGRTRCVFERVAYCVSNHCCLVDIRALSHNSSSIVPHGSALYVLLGVVPGTACVSSTDRHLNSAHYSSRQESSKNFRSEGKAKHKWRKDDLNKAVVTRQPGAIISLRDERVEILMQAR